MRIPRRLYGLGLIDAVDHAYVGSTFDEAPFVDRDLGLAILAAHQQIGLAIARGKLRRNNGGVIEGGFFVADLPAPVGALLALCLPGRCARGGCIKPVVAFQSLGIVLDLTAKLEGFLGVGT